MHQDTYFCNVLASQKEHDGYSIFESETPTSSSSTMGAFVPRQMYLHLGSIPRSYYLGHHAAGLSKMKSMVSQIDLVIECRDYRTPLVSRNPLFEANLGERPRLIVYTKQDLGSNFTNEDRQVWSLRKHSLNHGTES